MPGRKIRDERDGRACLEVVDKSGTERAAWARTNGIDARLLNAWRLNLDRSPTRPAELRLVELVPDVSGDAGFRVSCGPFVIDVPRALVGTR